MTSSVIGRGSCPSCGSTDNLVKYDDGHSHCFTPDCGYRIDGFHNDPLPWDEQPKEKPKVTKELKTGQPIQKMHRSIAPASFKAYGVTQQGEQVLFPYYDQNGSLSAQKVRGYDRDQAMYVTGSINGSQMFGQQMFKGGKYVTIVEGEFDALACYQLLGSKWPVVSVTNGATGALRNVKDNWDWLDQFDNVVIAFDSDDAGQTAARKVAELLAPKARIMPMSYKDANEYLQQGQSEKFVSDWWSAKTYTPDGIVAGQDLWEELSKDNAEALVLYPWEGLNDQLFGLREEELVTITAGSGLGKSAVLRELVWHIHENASGNIGLMFMEESIRKTGLSLMSLACNKPLHLPTTPVTLEEKKDAFDRTLGVGRLFLYDHFGSNDVDTIVSRVRYFAKVFDCKFVVLDHISIIVSAQAQGDERKAIDEIMTKLRMLVQELRIALIIVSHLKRPDSRGHEEGAVTSLSQLRGSASIAQLSDVVIGLERNAQAEDPVERNTTKVRVLKNRPFGFTGPACHLFYNIDTGRLNEVDNEWEDEFK